MRRDLEEYRGEGGPWTKTDAQVRKRGEQTGLDTLVVHAVNDVDLEVVPLRRGFRANALSRPPEVRPQG